MRKKIWTWLRNTVDLREGTDVKGTVDAIQKNIAIRGFNVWILGAAAIIASIGLDQESVAVIIGAMLISPLMSPILGVGLSIGINDRETLAHSLENLGVAVVASVLMSALYFWITPFGEMNAQIASRTQPTLLDVGVAFFGGVAGIVSISRKDITFAIPGVAIATALMPPLCVTGFGVVHFFETGEWEIFAGALYLFFLNSTFIVLSTYLIVRYLNFPYVDFIDAKRKRVVTRWMILFVFLIVTPSAYLFFQVITDLRTKQSITQFLDDQVNDKEHRVLDYKFIKSIKGKPDTLRVIVDGSSYIESNIQTEIELALGVYGLDSVKLDMQQLIAKEVNLDEFATKQETKFSKMLEVKTQVIDERDQQIVRLQVQRDSLYQVAYGFPKISKEMKIIYPTLESISLSNAQITSFNGRQDTLPLCLIKWKDTRTSSVILKRREQQLGLFLQERMELDTIKVVRE